MPPPIKITGGDDVTLQSLVSGNKEVLEDYRCGGCQRLKTCTKIDSMSAAPKVLVISLSRFDSSTGWLRKDQTKVSYSEYLELPVEHSEGANPAAAGGGGQQYELISVVKHRGGTINSGHYVAVCRHPNTGRWNEYNDAIITEDVVCPANKSCSEACIFIYGPVREQE